MSKKTKIERIEKRFETITGFDRNQKRRHELNTMLDKMSDSEHDDFLEICSDEDLDILLGISAEENQKEDEYINSLSDEELEKQYKDLLKKQKTDLKRHC
jgi:hypothetical protein